MPEKGLHEKNDLSFKRVTLSASQKGHVRRIASYPPNTVDGKNSAPVEVGSLAHYVSGFFLYPRWENLPDFFHQQIRLSTW